MRRSTRVTTQAAEENTSAHSEKGLFVVIMWNQESSSELDPGGWTGIVT